MPPQTPTAPKLSSDDFAAQIKAKYPAYANVDNATLTQKMLAKYPQYADRVDSSTNAPGPTLSPLQQAGKNYTDLATNVTNALGFGKTVDTLGTLLARGT